MSSTIAPPIQIKVAPRGDQHPGQESFVGGRPRLAPAIKLPACDHCGAPQTFFFQVGFPEGQTWSGMTLAIFECLDCEDMQNPVPWIDRNLSPSVGLGGLASGQDVPDGTLSLYQKRCRFLVFPTEEGTIRADYTPRIRYQPIRFEPAPEGKSTASSRVGGRPHWVQVDMTPGSYQGAPLDFLMQWRHDFLFNPVPGAAPEYNPHLADLPDRAADPYKLFLGTQLYFFGNRTNGGFQVYMHPQRV